MNYWEKVFKGSNGYYMDLDNPSRLVIKDYIKPTDSVLDLGCGGGALKSLLTNENYLGVDYSETAIKLATERFGAYFEVLDTRDLSKFKDNQFDVVVMRHFLENCENWRKTVEEAFRICNKKVILVMRRPFVNYESKILENPDDTWVWDINYDEFNILARNLSVNVSYGKVRDEELVIIGKHLDDVVFTLDDFHENNHRLDLLLSLKERFPKLKATLFTIPSKCSIEWLKDLKEKYDWIEFAVHGWFHDVSRHVENSELYPEECLNWSKEDANKYLKMAEDMGVFIKGFKAPGWGMNHDVFHVLQDRGYWVMDNKDRVHERPDDITNNYETGHLWEVNGHIQETPFNGLETMINNKLNFSENSNFYFVSEVVGTERDKQRLCH